MRTSRRPAPAVLQMALPKGLPTALLLALLASWACPAPPLHAAAKKIPAQTKETQSQAEPVDIAGRVAIGQDKAFIKDAQGYILVQGLDLTPFAGRNIQAKGLVIRKDQEYRTVRLLEYRIQSPDDDSPGAGGAVRQQKDQGRKKK